jgi:starvation-inducible DNA-binding protein
MSGSHFRDYHLLLDEQAGQIFAMTDPIAERWRKIGGTTIRSIGHIGRQQRILDNDAEYVDQQDMLAELRSDNQQSTKEMREVHHVVPQTGLEPLTPSPDTEGLRVDFSRPISNTW